LTGAAVLEFIGRKQGVFAPRGLQRGDLVALLSRNRVEAWIAGVAAQLSAMSITWLNGLGSFEDKLAQLEDFEADVLLVDATAFRERSGGPRRGSD
jgi:fatty-acyl-CoA synthase